MQKQSRQQLKFQALLGERAHFFKHNVTETESILWWRSRLGYRVLRLPAELVRGNLEEAVALVIAALTIAT